MSATRGSCGRRGADALRRKGPHLADRLLERNRLEVVRVAPSTRTNVACLRGCGLACAIAEGCHVELRI